MRLNSPTSQSLIHSLYIIQHCASFIILIPEIKPWNWNLFTHCFDNCMWFLRAFRIRRFAISSPHFNRKLRCWQLACDSELLLPWRVITDISDRLTRLLGVLTFFSWTKVRLDFSCLPKRNRDRSLRIFETLDRCALAREVQSEHPRKKLPFNAGIVHGSIRWIRLCGRRLCNSSARKSSEPFDLCKARNFTFGK